MNITIRDPSIVADCERAGLAAESDLMALAVARGCLHYAPLVEERSTPAELKALPQEVLACALLRYPMPEGFDAFRCGAMVLSDRSNQPAAIAGAADYFGVGARVGHVVRLGLAHDDGPEFWREMLPLFPDAANADVLPGPSRLVSETRLSGLNRGPVRIWLRTAYRP